MKNKDVIEMLSKLDGELEVCIFDWRKNIYNATAEPTSEGIDSQFTIGTLDGTKPFIGLAFSNDDYTDSGEPNYGSALVNNVSQAKV
jgi:hypothetical protein